MTALFGGELPDDEYDGALFGGELSDDEYDGASPGEELPTVDLTFPKEKCTEIVIKGKPFIRIDTGLTLNELMLALMKYGASGDGFGAVVKNDEESDEESKQMLYDNLKRMKEEKE